MTSRDSSLQESPSGSGDQRGRAIAAYAPSTSRRTCATSRSASASRARTAPYSVDFSDQRWRHVSTSFVPRTPRSRACVDRPIRRYSLARRNHVTSYLPRALREQIEEAHRKNQEAIRSSLELDARHEREVAESNARVERAIATLKRAGLLK